MRVSRQLRTTALVVGGLIVGSIIGPPLAQAASAGLVRLEGAGSSHVAKVNRAGQLSVNLPTTTTGQLNVAQASPKSVVVKFSFPSCNSGGIFTIPAGKALIITSVDFYNFGTAGTAHQLVLQAGPKATPCTHFLAVGVGSDAGTSQNQVFPSGIPVPAGDALGLESFGDNGSAEVYGYLVPASTVPLNVLSHARSGPVGANKR
jgi:hypothetical protein